MKGVNRRRRCNSPCLYITSARMWLVHILGPTKDEGCKANTNKAYTISKWNTKEQLMVQ